MKRKIKVISGILVLMCLIVSNINAQEFFVKFNAGYNFAFDDDDHEIFMMLYNSTTIHTATSTLISKENIQVSFGKGINLTLTPGYMFNKNFGAELGISYLFGLKTEGSQIEHFLNGSEIKNTNSVKGSLISLTPSFLFAAGFKKIDPYSKFGVIIGFPSFTHESYYYNINSDIYRDYNEYSGSIAFGVCGAIGVKYPVSGKFGTYIELAMNSLNYSPSKSILSESTLNGNDLLPTMTTSEKEVEYVDQYSYDNSVPADPDKPGKFIKFTVPFSSIAINLGVSMKF